VTGTREALWFRASFALLAAFACALLWASRYPPMTDLPQHAAQLAVWSHHDDAAWGFAARYEINPRTPYMLGYLLARPFAGLGALAALKVVLTAAALGLPLAALALLRATGADPWWSLLAFPVFFGFNFSWGFLEFLVATPLAVLAVALAVRHCRAPAAGSAAALASLLTATLATHALAFGAAAAACGLLAAAALPRARRRLALLLPFPLPVAAALAWAAVTVRAGGAAGDPALRAAAWGSARLASLPGLLAGTGAADLPATILGLGFLALPLLWRPRSGGTAALPFLAAAALYALVPEHWLHYFMLYQRFAPLLLIFFLAGLLPGRPALPPHLLRGCLLALLAAWAALAGARFQRFAGEAQGFDGVIARLPAAPRLEQAAFAPGSSAFGGLPLFLHFAAYAQAARGGELAHSFARYPHALARYRGYPAEGWNREEGDEWHPERIPTAPPPGRTPFEYVLARSSSDRAGLLFPRGGATLLAHEGLWWLYRREGAGG
jgi:hypothetical protein